MTKARLESFSDGIFAFAITLLVLGVTVPNLNTPSDMELRRALLSSATQLIPYVTSFAAIGVIWLNHHSLFESIGTVRHTTLSLNLLLLLVVAFIPYPTAVLERFGPLSSCTFLYGAVMSMLGFAYTLLSWHVTNLQMEEGGQLDATPKRKAQKSLVGALVYPATTALSFRTPRLSVAVYFALGIFYFVPKGVWSAGNLEEG